MLQLSQEFSSGAARLRIDVHGLRPVAYLLEDMNFMNYRLAEVAIEPQVASPAPHMVWQQDAAPKGIRYDQGVLTLEGEWFEGEIQKIIVSMLALQMEKTGLHPFHASAVRYRGHTIMFLGGETNHGKTMCQIEGCRRGGLVVSTETTVTDERGWAVLGSKNVFLRKRAKGAERADLPNQDQGVAKFFNQTPEFINFNEASDVDLVILPDIDGHYDTAVTKLAQFEKEYQAYHSVMNYFGLNQLLAPGLPMPVIDTDELRVRRADFVSRFARRPYYLIRAKTPQVVFDEVERLQG
jgi:hypothetical protein